MYVYGRGPMDRDFGAMGGRMHHRPVGFRPTGMRHPVDSFLPMGVLFLLPALMFGGWIAIAVLGAVLSLIGTVIGGVFHGLASLAYAGFSGGGLAVGIVIGLAAYCLLRKGKNAEDSGRAA